MYRYRIYNLECSNTGIVYSLIPRGFLPCPRAQRPFELYGRISARRDYSNVNVKLLAHARCLNNDEREPKERTEVVMGHINQFSVVEELREIWKGGGTRSTGSIIPNSATGLSCCPFTHLDRAALTTSA